MPKEDKKDKEKASSSKTSLHSKIAESVEIKTLLTWEAPSRPYRKKNRSYYTTLAVIVVLLVLILLLAREFLLIGTILALSFVAYALAFVPPHDVKYRISTQGVTIGDDFYFWHLLDAFWFKERDYHKILIIQTKLRFPAQLMMVLPGNEEESVKKMVARFLPYVEVPYKSWMEKWSEGLEKHFPLENINR